MLKRASTLAASAALLMIAPAAAAEVRDHPKAVLELFTSQGCDSCPQADARLNQLRQQPDIIALAYHVDYWDYIGWKDTFGMAANSERQKSYAQSWGTSRIYTPELVVNGAKGVIASHEDDVSKALGAAALTVPVGIKVGTKMLEVTVAPVAGANEAVVWLVTFRDHAQVAIDKGENAGKTMDYTQIVTGRQMLGLWDPTAGTHLKLPLAGLMSDGANGAAILIQTDNGGLPGPIVGAASVQL
jgi:hypothetical protein